MLHSHVKIWVHIIWSTYNRERILHKDLRSKLFRHLLDSSKGLGIITEQINIQPEHVHCLIDLPSDKNLADIVKGLKGESSRWINEEGLVEGRFKWQRGYGAFSVSASQLEIVKRYIENQDEHHQRKPFHEEYDEWKGKYGIQDDGNDGNR
ncbi:IS200/IS605 family transposase [bacterium]|nr:IS200/IS605 family transposase [bacterium]MBU1753901.1 IS200/IS605 family transposase [bacterium]